VSRLQGYAAFAVHNPVPGEVLLLPGGVQNAGHHPSRPGAAG